MAGADAIPEYVSAAVADPGRPDTDRQRDADRQPAEVVAFAGIKPGDKVADFMPGRGYFTRIFCKAVGAAGHVYAVSVPLAVAAEAQPLAPLCGNVAAVSLRAKNYPAPELHSSSDDPGWIYEYWSSRLPAESFEAPEPLDVIWLSEGYHDLHSHRLGAPDMSLVNQALFMALKPGGVLIVEDHAAASGSGARDTETLHRIDPELVKKEITAAGFVFAGASMALRRSQDAHKARAHELHDKTDRFLFKFRKP